MTIIRKSWLGPLAPDAASSAGVDTASVQSTLDCGDRFLAATEAKHPAHPSGYGDIGAYGGGELRGARTPRIDQIAAEGLWLLRSTPSIGRSSGPCRPQAGRRSGRNLDEAKRLEGDQHEGRLEAHFRRERV